MFRDPGFCRAGYSKQQQRAIGSQCGDGCFDQAPVADIFWRDLDALFGAAAKQIGCNRLRRKLPIGGTDPCILRSKRLKFDRVNIFRRLSELDFAVPDFACFVMACSPADRDWVRVQGFE